MMKILKPLFGVCLLVQAVAGYAIPGESIVRNAAGDYIITYWNGASLMQTIFIPATKIDPVISSTFHVSEQEGVIYQYKLFNKTYAQQPIIALQLLQVSSIKSQHPITDLPAEVRDTTTAVNFVKARRSALSIPTGWSGDVSPTVPTGFFVEWHYVYKSLDQDDLAEGLLAGRNQSGFGFTSFDLPGVAAAQIQGDGRHPEYEDEGPDTDSEIVSQLDKLEGSNFVHHNVAVPTIAIPEPFDPAVTLERIQEHMHTWIAKQLIDPAFSAQLDSHFKTAADVYRKQGSAGNGQIGRMLALLVQQYEGLEKGDEELVKKKSAVPAQIDKLAALVLYFDLKYVMRRMGGGN